MAVARASVNVMKCGVRVRRGTRRHVFDAVASRHPRRRRLRGVDDDDDNVDDDNDEAADEATANAVTSSPSTPRVERGGGGLSVELGLGVDNDDNDVDNDDDTRLPMQLPLTM